MGVVEDELAPSKKRVAGRELSRDNMGLDDENESLEEKSGTFKRASNDVLATRRIVKVKRHQPSSVAVSTNPFASIHLVTSTQSASDTAVSNKAKEVEVVNKEELAVAKENNGSAESGNKQVEERDENLDAREESKNNSSEELGQAGESNEKPDDGGVGADNVAAPLKSFQNLDAKEESKTVSSEELGQVGEACDKPDTGGVVVKNVAAPLNSFQQLSGSQNAFTGLAGTGFSASSFSFGSFSKNDILFRDVQDSSLGPRSETPPPFFNIINSKCESGAFLPMQGALETGEENENVVFTGDASLFEFVDGGWKERGKGEVRVNVSMESPKKARLVMRVRGNFRLILNAGLHPDITLKDMDKKGVTFACMNSVGEWRNDLSTLALKFKEASAMEEFKEAVIKHKGEMSSVLRTPENSPKESTA